MAANSLTKPTEMRVGHIDLEHDLHYPTVSNTSFRCSPNKRFERESAGGERLLQKVCVLDDFRGSRND